MKARPNERDVDYNISAKIDARFSKNIDFTVAATIFDSKNRFTPGGWGMYNWTNNPYAYSGGYRGNVRIRHKLGNQTLGPDSERKNALIRNASYTIQFGYEKKQKPKRRSSP